MFGFETFQESEILSLILAGPLCFATLLLCRRMLAPYALVILAAVIFALGAILFTVLEDIAFHGFFNGMEHLCYALTGLSLGIGCWLATRERRDTERKETHAS